MSLWRQITRGFRVLTRRNAADQDLADEVEHYLAEAAAAREAEGLSAEEARRAVRMELGSATAVREQVRDYGWENAVDTLLSDLRLGLRRLRKRPGFALTAVLTLALGIGAATAIFSAVHPILLEALPYPGAARLMMIWEKRTDGRRADVTFGTYRELVERSRSFESLAVMRSWHPTASGMREPERLDGQRVSAGYFRVLGIAPALGRDFDERDDRPNGPRVALISDGLWRRRFGAERAIIGREITLDGRPYSILGVMPRGFENVLAPSAEIWSLLQYDLSLPTGGREWGHHLHLVGRLRPRRTIDDAQRELGAIAHTPVAELSRPSWSSFGQGFIVSSLQEDLTRDVRPVLVAVAGAVMLLLAIACVNVTNLLLAHGAERRAEFAMRVALGAPRSRLVRQLLTESLLLATLGGALGMALAHAGVRFLVALTPDGLPRASEIGIDGTVFAFALGLTTLAGALVGLIPARHTSRPHVPSSRIAGGQRVMRGTLVVVQVALALVLLIGAGLLLRSLQRLFAEPLGFRAEGLLTMQVQTGGSPRYRDNDSANRFFEQALEAVQRVPGVSTAAFTSQLPLTGEGDTYGLHFESSPTQTPDGATFAGFAKRSACRYAVTPGWFEAMGIPLLRGRALDARDRAGAPLAVVINESLARKRFPNQNPIGQRLRIGAESGPWHTVVGIAGDMKQWSLEIAPADAFYITAEQWRPPARRHAGSRPLEPFVDNARWLVVRANAGATESIRRAIWSVDPNRPILRVATMEERVAESVSARRFALILFELFAAVALLLAAIGIYGVLSGSVTERTREIGIRTALGASRANILALVFRQGMTLAALGALIGLIGAIAGSRVLATLLFGVSRLDAITYAAVILLLAGVSAIACSLPAWRASRVAPAVALQSE